MNPLDKTQAPAGTGSGRRKWCRIAVLALVAAALLPTSTAQARLPQPARILLFHADTLKPRTHLRLADSTITYADHVLGFLRTNRSAGTRHSRAVVRRDHEWLLRLGEQHRAAALHQLQVAARPAHYQGWLCIHGGTAYGARYGTGEGAWDDEDSGHNGHLGGLQMSPGWGGVANAALLPAMAQMRLAERGYEQSGFSHAWLAGQWPNTYPPCAQFF